MARRPSPRGVALYFRKLGPRTQVALCQLPLSLIVTVLGVMTPLAWPSLLSSPFYLAGLALHALLFLTAQFHPGQHRPGA